MRYAKTLKGNVYPHQQCRGVFFILTYWISAPAPRVATTNNEHISCEMYMCEHRNVGLWKPLICFLNRTGTCSKADIYSIGTLLISVPLITSSHGNLHLITSMQTWMSHGGGFMIGSIILRTWFFLKALIMLV
jgi:hypothetical protein